MVAAENGALPGGKVGGMGDVVRDLPRALARQGHRVSVLTPSYGFLARLPGVRRRGAITVPFAGGQEICQWLELPGDTANVDYYLLDHPRFSPGGIEEIYHDDGEAAPFATDAGKFAFFCAATAALLNDLKQKPDVLHLHDWHLGLYLLLRGFDPRYRKLRSIRTVFTIHNLSLQGIRPVNETDSAIGRWFPALKYPPAVVADLRYPQCANPLAVAIRLADAVNTVSPSYAREILLPGDARSGRHGGESLESVLAERNREGALTGILNGCEYPAAGRPKSGWKQLVAGMNEELGRWIAAGTYVEAAAYLAEKRLASLPRNKPAIVATSVGRITEQKLGLLTERVSSTATALDRVLMALDDGILIMLGSGDPEYEKFLQRAAVEHDNLIYLKGYSERLSESLYAAGDLFLMPSVFEPCGISQMLAMRAGQPCVAHAVGGLRDTVSAANGFPFEGATPKQQAQNLAREVAAAVDLKLKQPGKWRAIVNRARRERFSWDISATRYLREVYAFGADSG